MQNWASTKKDADTYYTYINSDPVSWSAYIYHANEDANVSYDSMKFYVENSTVKLFITSADTIAEQRSSYFLILIQAPSRAVWPNEVDVYIDDMQLENEILDASTCWEYTHQTPVSAPCGAATLLTEDNGAN